MAAAIKKLFSGKDTSSAPQETSSFNVVPRVTLPKLENSPRILIIGAGSRGRAYAWSIATATNGTVVGVAEPDEYKRKRMVQEHNISDELVFTSWTELVGEHKELVMSRVDGVCVCTLDETHEEIVLAIRPLNLHILCEKPLSTTLESCVRIAGAVSDPELPPVVLAIAHVLRYSPHNILMKKLVCEDKLLGEVVNVNHTEPVGWYHFAHSYVRGNWRKKETSAPSLLTKCCHDIDLLLWLLCSPSAAATPHLPSTVSSSGSLVHFRRSRKPAKAGNATNCLSCPAEPDCTFSAKKIYVEKNLNQMNMGWPVKIVVPDIEEAHSMDAAEAMLTQKLAEDYGREGTMVNGEQKSYYGRCVYETDNNVVDNQVVTISWDDDTSASTSGAPAEGRGAKTATLNMVAFSEKICERFTRIYGTKGELEADSNQIRIYDFETGVKKTWVPSTDLLSGHGGGDSGLAKAFVGAIDKVKNEAWAVDRAQREVVGVTVEEVLRSHAAVFWAEDARVNRQMLEWGEWWAQNVEV
ncbi:NAD(P)-binding protein [Choiromyces venosus 120613-1]|uniref:NAD(P)-binding protein n=1 Tax=Choiromyces venosus 120613-1 TaxID=1336337 RepID=A0A3N4K0M6_9PEZI|nr:NAD(P)-binding protein [Choiromyces venosus 120613-1]